MVDRDLQVLYVHPALSGPLGYVPDETTADLLERSGWQVERADGSPWPLAERPVQLAGPAVPATELEELLTCGGTTAADG